MISLNSRVKTVISNLNSLKTNLVTWIDLVYIIYFHRLVDKMVS